MIDDHGRPAHVVRPRTSFEDHRGTITDLFQGEAFDAGSVITTRRGGIRGNHYHRETVQVMYIISGRLRLVTRIPGEEAQTWHGSAGDLVWTREGEEHAIEALDELVILVLTKGPRGGTDYESDTYRLAQPLIDAT